MRWSALLALVALGCKRTPTEVPPPPTPTEEPDPILGFLPPGPRATFPEARVTDADQDGVPEALDASWPVEVLTPARSFQRSLGYAVAPDGSYEASLRLHFGVIRPDALGEITHQEDIPKSFATDVAGLAFDPAPTQVVDPDPVVQFTFVEGFLLVEADAVQPVPAIELQARSDETLASYGLQQCLALDDDAYERCVVSLIARFPSTATVADLAEQPCDGCEAVVSAASTGDWSACDGSADPEGCYSLLFAVHADTGCRDVPDLGACLMERWSELPPGELRDRVCFDVQVHNGLAGWLDWSGFEGRCLQALEEGYCETLEDPLRARCISAEARAAGDLSVCDGVGPGDQERCEDEMFLYGFADLAACDALADAELRDTCAYIVAVRDGETSRCLQFPAAARNACLALAVTANADLVDPSICEGFQVEDDDVPIEGLRDICLLQMATRVGDVLVCAGMTTAARAACELAVGAYIGHGAQCDLVEAPVVRCDCLTFSALEIEDRSLCAQQGDPAARTACEEGVTLAERADAEALLASCRTDCEDADGDGAPNLEGCAYGTAGDCDDTDPDVGPEEHEDCEDGVDNDCNRLVDCDDPECVGNSSCPAEPTTVSFLEHAGEHTVTLAFPGGEGDRVELIPEAVLGQSVYGWGELVRVWLPGFPSDPAYWDGSVPVEVSVAPLEGTWRLYAATGPSDPASRITSTWWEPGNSTVPMRGDRFYWLYIWPDVGTEKLEVLQLKGELLP
ncbi:MAG: putative metal-binding motif-containing protein [Myxococcales bacterium]|nr:putative metal-binding motif-containing protein [Myxococcales bacterium]